MAEVHEVPTPGWPMRPPLPGAIGIVEPKRQAVPSGWPMRPLEDAIREHFEQRQREAQAVRAGVGSRPIRIVPEPVGDAPPDYVPGKE